MVDFANSTQKRAWFFKDDPSKLQDAFKTKALALRAKIASYYKLQEGLTPETIDANSKRYQMPPDMEEKLLMLFNDQIMTKGI